MNKRAFTLAEVIISLSITAILIVMISNIFIQKKKSNNPLLSKSGTFVCYKDIDASGGVILRQATLIGGVYKNDKVAKCSITFPSDTSSYSITVIGAGGGGAGGKLTTVISNVPYSSAYKYSFLGACAKTKGSCDNAAKKIEMPPEKYGPLSVGDFNKHILSNVTYSINGAGGASTGKVMQTNANNFHSFAIGGRGYRYDWLGNLEFGDTITSNVGKKGNSATSEVSPQNLKLHNSDVVNASYATDNIGVRTTKYYNSWNADGTGKTQVDMGNEYISGYFGVKYGRGEDTTFTINREKKGTLKIKAPGGNGAIYNGYAWQYKSSATVDKDGVADGEAISTKKYKGAYNWYNCTNLNGITTGTATYNFLLKGRYCSVDGTNAGAGEKTLSALGGKITREGPYGGVSTYYEQIYDRNDNKRKATYSTDSAPGEDGSVTISPVSRTFQFFENEISTYQTDGGGKGTIAKTQIRAVTNNKIEISPSLIGNPGFGGAIGASGKNGSPTCFSLTNNPSACLLKAAGGIGGASNVTAKVYQQNIDGGIELASKAGAVTIVGKNGACGSSCFDTGVGGTKEDINGHNAVYGASMSKEWVENEGVYGSGGGSGANVFEFTRLLYSLSVDGGKKMLCNIVKGNNNQQCGVGNLSQGNIKSGQKQGTGGMGAGGAIIIKW